MKMNLHFWKISPLKKNPCILLGATYILNKDNIFSLGKERLVLDQISLGLR